MMDEHYYRKFEPFFGKWRVSKKIGEGAFGKVYEIYWDDDLGTHNRSALKLIHIPTDEALRQQRSEQSSESAVRNYFARQVERFREEIVILQRCKGHSNIVSYEDHMIIEDKEKIGWDILIKMELLYPITAYLSRPQATQYDVLRMWQDISNALIFCDEQRVIHRDIKPANIMVTGNGTFKLADFGAARKVMESQNASTRIGTEQYMAPEVLLRQKYDKRVDIYSLGCVIYFYLNQKRHMFFPPYPMEYSVADKEAAFDKRVKGEKVPRIPGISNEINNVLLKSVSYKPGNRQSDAKELYDEVHKLLLQEGQHLSRVPLAAGTDVHSSTSDRKSSEAVRPRTDRPAPAQKSKKGLLIGISCLCLLAAVGIILGGIFWKNSSSEEKTMEKADAADAGMTPPEPVDTTQPEPADTQEAPRPDEPAAASVPTDTPVPTSTPRPTNTHRPTSTPRPTNTHRPTSTPKPTSTPRPTNTPRPTSTPAPDWKTFKTLNEAQTGDLVVFGQYEQDTDVSGKEDIEWYVIKTGEKMKLLLSKKAILQMEEYQSTWETSDCRRALNGDFLRNAFSEEEARRIALTENTVEKGTITDSANNQKYNLIDSHSFDRVFLLSSTEGNDFYKITAGNRSAYDCQPSAYAKARGVKVNDGGYCTWRVRDYTDNGFLWSKFPTGEEKLVVETYQWGIRPAVWVYTGNITNDSTTVKQIQKVLESKGYSCGGADGVLGEGTMKAILEYQKKNNMTACGLITDELKLSLLF